MVPPTQPSSPVEDVSASGVNAFDTSQVCTASIHATHKVSQLILGAAFRLQKAWSGRVCATSAQCSRMRLYPGI